MPGQARYGLVCNERGGILDDVLVYRFEAFFMMVVNASNREKMVAWLGTGIPALAHFIIKEAEVVIGGRPVLAYSPAAYSRSF